MVAMGIFVQWTRYMFLTLLVHVIDLLLHIELLVNLNSLLKPIQLRQRLSLPEQRLLMILIHRKRHISTNQGMFIQLKHNITLSHIRQQHNM